MYGNDSISSINNRNYLVTKEDLMRHQFNIVFQKVQNYNNSTIEKATIECICCEISCQHRKKDYFFLASDGSPIQFFYMKRSNNKQLFVCIVDNFQLQNLEDFFPYLYQLNLSNHDLILQNMRIKK